MPMYENSKQLNIAQLQYNNQNLSELYPKAPTSFSEEVLEAFDFAPFIHFFEEEKIEELTIVPSNDLKGAFIFKMSLKELTLTTKSSIKKVRYQFDLTTLSLTINDRKADHSFYDNFLKKISRISSLLLQNKAVAYGS